MTSTRETIDHIFERLNAHDVEALLPLWTAETVDYFPHGALRGTEEIAGFFREMMAALPDVKWDIQTIVTEGDTAFVHWIYTGTFTGAPLMGFNATGHRIELEGMDKFVFADGVIKTVHVRYDQMTFAQQIGALPPTNSIAERLGKQLFNAWTTIQDLIRRS